MTQTVLETWEESPTHEGDVERHVVDAGAPIFVVHYQRDHAVACDAWHEGFKRLAAELQERSPGAMVLALPSGWHFRVVRIEEDDDAA